MWAKHRDIVRNHPDALRVTTLVVSIFAIMAGHWFVPTDSLGMHVAHILLRKLFLIPVIAAAVWYGLRGSLIVAAICALFYIPYIWADWVGAVGENMNQYGELLSIAAAAVTAGILASKEKRALTEVADVHEGALEALISALDAREHDTQSHSQRVKALAMRIGTAMGLGREELMVLGQGALLHDIGKVGIPDNILLKSSTLTPAEWHIMRKHPDIGWQILETIPFLRRPAELVRTHHEKFDGSGYPRGLAGNKIPLGARIFAVADAFDALTSDRPYQKGICTEAAKRQIERASGRHFDPDVVACFLSLPLGPDRANRPGTQRAPLSIIQPHQAVSP